MNISDSSQNTCMSSLDLRMQELHQLVYCVYCTDDRDTKVLDCHHNLCTNCLTKLQARPRTFVNCPVCQHVTEFPKEGFLNLPSNILAQQLYLHSKLLKDFRNDISCTVCLDLESRTAEYYCSRCNKYFCGRDFNYHNMSIVSNTSLHKTMNKSDIIKPIPPGDTTLDSIHESVGELKSRAEQVSDILKDLNFQKEYLTSEEEKLKVDINDQFLDIHAKITAREEYIRSILSAHYQQQRKELDNCIDSVSELMMRLFHEINFMNTALLVTDRDVTVSLSQSIKDNIQLKLDQINLNEITFPDFEPLVFKTDTDIINDVSNFGNLGINRNYATIDQPSVMYCKKSANLPGRIAIDNENGHIFVVDQTDIKIDIFKAEGGYLRSFGSEGTEDGLFLKPFAICCKSNRILVSDLLKSNVQIFDLRGNYLTQFGNKDLIRCPTGIDLWKNGDIIVSDQTKHRIVQYSSSFKFFSFIGEGKLKKPYDVKTCSWADIFFVLNLDNKSIYSFTRKGELVKVFESERLHLQDPFSLAVDNLGYLFISDAQCTSLTVVNWNGTKTDLICPSESNHRGIAIDNKGRIVVSQFNKDRIQIVIF